jgi:DNA-binding IscR family transcriptional regulator
MKYKTHTDSKKVIINFFENRPGQRMKMTEIEQLTGISNREIRGTISELRKQGILILSSCSGDHMGYYLATTPEEVREGVADLVARARDLSQTIRGIQRGTIQKFGNQIHIDFGESL